MEPQTVATAAAQKRKRPGQETTATTSSSSSADSALCTNGCCFLGTAADRGMCSKCYRERHPAGDDTERPDQEVKAVRSTSVFAVPPPLKKIKLSVPTIGSSSAGAASSAGAVDTSSSPANTATQKKEGPAKPATATANRCMTCRKKVGLTGFQCRCGGTFCGSHRYADAHACGFDYKAAGREQIAKQNPVVVAAKIAKI